MFKSVLVANRGEIACRVFRTARRMGIRTIAVYSEADADALFVREADEAVLIGPAPARESYLDQGKVLAAAKATGAEAIHPGYGFLSENADFAEAVQAAGLVWIGAPAASIRAMGLKDAAKKLMVEAGVPVTPGYMGDDQSEARLEAEADAIGYPVLIKAVAGGGGKGMRRVDAADAFLDALSSCRREAASSFGDDRVLIEKYILSPRHIEVQVFGDQHGTVVHLNERDCSLQRRHQKVIEEAPAPGMDAATRAAITDAAVRAARAVDYVGAGTIEFIADASDGLRADRIWFMEMNTRLQVEHPVTEMITGVDLVEWQFRAAAGQPVPLKQGDIPLNGWAMEARLYAEDPANGFLPSIGKLEHFRLPHVSSPQGGEGDREAVEGVFRIDTGVEQGGEVSQFYDPMIAKLIVHAATREEAAAALADACGQVEVWPVRTNAGFLKRCLEHSRFVAGEVDTGFIGKEETALLQAADAESLAGAGGAILLEQMRWDMPYYEADPTPWGPASRSLFGFRLNGPSRTPLKVTIDGKPCLTSLTPSFDDMRQFSDEAGKAIEVDHGSHFKARPAVVRFGDKAARFSSDQDEVLIFLDGDAHAVRWFAWEGAAGASTSDGALRAPMPGKIVAAPVKAGEAVTKGQPVIVLEAMKMEHALTAPFDGVAAEINAAVGDQAAADAVLALVKAE